MRTQERNVLMEKERGRKKKNKRKAKLDKDLSGVRNTGTAEDVMDPPPWPTVSQPVIQETVATSSTSVASVDEADD